MRRAGSNDLPGKIEESPLSIARLDEAASPREGSGMSRLYEIGGDGR